MYFISIEVSLGKSCSLKELHTTVLFNPQSFSSSQQRDSLYYSTFYTAQSDRSIITFHLGDKSRVDLDDISIYDIVNKSELIEDGGFESGTLSSYCLCESSTSQVKADRFFAHSAPYILEMSTFFSPTKLSQLVYTTPGQKYNVSFWLPNRFGSNKNHLTVFMSTALNSSDELL